MTPEFQKTLQGNPNQKNSELKTPSMLNKFTELNKEMYKANKNLTTGHPYSSFWYTWPLMTRPIYYWVRDNPSAGSGQAARIYLLGNPITWWGSTIAVIFLAISLLSEKLKVKSSKLFENDFISYFLLGGWTINLLPFVGIKRAMFLYHYFTAFIFAVITLVYIIDRFDELTTGKTSKNPRKLFVGLIVCASIFFVFFAPLSYGLNMSDKQYEARFWLSSWK